MKVLLISEVHFVEFNPMLETLLRQSKLKMFRAGFLKKNGSYRHGKFDLRGRTKFKNNQGDITTIKGKGRTTNPDRVLQAFEPEIKRYTNMIFDNIKWFSIGKKLFKINLLEEDFYRWSEIDDLNFSLLKELINPKEIHKDDKGNPYYAVPEILRAESQGVRWEDIILEILKVSFGLLSKVVMMQIFLDHLECNQVY